MSVLIQGIPYPKTCTDCLLHDTEDDYCRALDRYVSNGRPEWCPLVEIKTPHGDLKEFIDVTTTVNEDDGTQEVNLGEAFAAYFKMREAPVVIEAEGAEE